MSEWLDADGDPLPDRMELKPNRLSWFFMFLISAGFVAIAIWIGPKEDPGLFWFGGGFFLICALVSTPLMLGVGSRLILERDSFTCHTLFRSFTRKWRECSDFLPVYAGARRFVGFTTQQDEAAHPNMAAVNRAVLGASAAVPETFGISAEELADLMNRFRARALAQ